MGFAVATKTAMQSIKRIQTEHANMRTRHLEITEPLGVYGKLGSVSANN